MLKEIRIAEQFRPFSHLPGTKMLIPQSAWQLTAYPTLLVLTSLEEPTKEPLELGLDLTSAVRDFTLVQDLEERSIRLFGRSSKGCFSYSLYATKTSLALKLERYPEESASLMYRGKKILLKRKEEWELPVLSQFLPLKWHEKIHFGSHKAQDFDLIRRRSLLEEITPLWFALGQGMPTELPSKSVATRGLKKLEELINQRNRNEVGSAVLDLFRTSFDGLFAPRCFDTAHWEFSLEKKEELLALNPLFLLGKGAQLIRSLFIQADQNTCSILPCLPKELHAGRLIRARPSPDLRLDLEWSKKRIRRLVLTASKDRQLMLNFFSKERSFRLRSATKELNVRLNTHTLIELKANQRYFLDCFER